MGQYFVSLPPLNPDTARPERPVQAVSRVTKSQAKTWPLFTYIGAAAGKPVTFINYNEAIPEDHSHKFLFLPLFSADNTGPVGLVSSATRHDY